MRLSSVIGIETIPYTFYAKYVAALVRCKVSNSFSGFQHNVIEAKLRLAVYIDRDSINDQKGIEGSEIRYLQGNRTISSASFSPAQS